MKLYFSVEYLASDFKNRKEFSQKMHNCCGTVLTLNFVFLLYVYIVQF